MQTIHIDSLDELPHAAAAVINALEGWICGRGMSPGWWAKTAQAKPP